MFIMFKRMFIPMEDIRAAFTCGSCTSVVVVDVKRGIQNSSVCSGCGSRFNRSVEVALNSLRQFIEKVAETEPQESEPAHRFYLVVDE
jgi:transcription elongation factor Elf1